ncbi:MAG: thermonuclease family protein [Haloarculaceae archaeon]
MGHLPRVLLVACLIAVAGCGATGVTGTDTQISGVDTPTATVDGSAKAPVDADGTGRDDFEPARTVDVSVVRVVDGDTIDVRLPDGSEDTVRLVGIDTPEIHVENEPGEYEGVPDTEAGARCLRRAGHSASEYLTGRLDGSSVTLTFDPRTDRRGEHDRLLAYVYQEGENLNHELVAAGHARMYDTEFTFREAFEASEAEARDRSRGLWTCRDGS